MTIDELFDMPICEMKEWMAKNFKKSEPELVGTYCFFNIKDSFDLEIPKDSNWRIIPTMSTFGTPKNGWTHLDNIMNSFYDTYKFSVAKISKFGECLVYMFEGSFELNKGARYDYCDNRRNVHFELKKIYCNSSKENEACRCYIDGPDVVNNSALGVYYRETDPNFKRENDSWVHDFEFIDKYPSIRYKTLPKIGGINKNKHSLNEYNSALEKFAEKCLRLGKPFYDEHKDIVHDAALKEKCNKVHIAPQDVFDLWVELYIQNQSVTIDDVIGMIELAQNNTELVEEYREKNKCGELKKDWNNNYNIKHSNWYSPYHLSLLFGDTEYINTELFYGYLNDLEETRKFYMSLDDYKKTITTAKKEYKDSFTTIAKKWEEHIRDIYGEITKKLENAKQEYLNETSELYTYIHDTYPGVNDSDVNIFEDITDITDGIEKCFESTAIKLMRLVDPKYKPLVEFKTIKTDEEGFTEAFKDHCKIFFDAVSECSKLPYYRTGKGYDAPYETWEWDCEELIFDCVDEDHIFLFEEKYGQGSYDEWAEKFAKLAPYDKTWESNANELYPGRNLTYYITKDFKGFEEETD